MNSQPTPTAQGEAPTPHTRAFDGDKLSPYLPSIGIFHNKAQTIVRLEGIL